MSTDQHQTSGAGSRATEPDVRILGVIALVLAVVGLVLAPTYLLSFYAFPAAVLAVVVGLVARSDARTRRAGSTAIGVALLSAVVATATLLLG